MKKTVIGKMFVENVGILGTFEIILSFLTILFNLAFESCQHQRYQSLVVVFIVNRLLLSIIQNMIGQ